MKKAVIYLRTSTEEQHPENQLEECRRFAESRGYAVGDEDVYLEHVSAWKKNVERPYYDKIKHDAHTGIISAVIVWSVDRWIRDMQVLVSDLAYFADRNVKFHSVKEHYIETMNIEGPLGRTIREFLYGLVGSIAEMESQRLSERTKRGMERARKQGKQIGRPKATFNRYRAAQLISEGVSIGKIAKELGSNKATIFRFKNQLLDSDSPYLKGVSETLGGPCETEEVKE
jgi:DNA invertase Pin-like site-specific DNA recombinase